ncbi:MAG: hypothetical protein EZS28_001439 [Streblomastix strix]|uniref:Uncharacterized protein n=1 Tax=Streblomastix strix TaxID=222440 RepID=A0A5J4X8X7_9EUKA|nr:MAG: hypothetical protein EZS28_001439 [Streblomastix strix]
MNKEQLEEYEKQRKIRKKQERKERKIRERMREIELEKQQREAAGIMAKDEKLKKMKDYFIEKQIRQHITAQRRVDQEKQEIQKLSIAMIRYNQIEKKSAHERRLRSNPEIWKKANLFREWDGLIRLYARLAAWATATKEYKAVQLYIELQQKKELTAQSQWRIQAMISRSKQSSQQMANNLADNVISYIVARRRAEKTNSAITALEFLRHVKRSGHMVAMLKKYRFTVIQAEKITMCRTELLLLQFDNYWEKKIQEDVRSELKRLIDLCDGNPQNVLRKYLNSVKTRTVEELAILNGGGELPPQEDISIPEGGQGIGGKPKRFEVCGGPEFIQWIAVMIIQLQLSRLTATALAQLQQSQQSNNLQESRYQLIQSQVASQFTIPKRLNSVLSRETQSKFNQRETWIAQKKACIWYCRDGIP